MGILKKIIYTLIILSIFSSLLLSEKLKNTVKWLFSLIFTVVLLTSIISVIKNVEYKNTKIFETNSGYYLTNALISKNENDEEILKDFIKTLNIENFSISSEYELKNNTIYYKKIQINLKNAVINSNKSHINIQNEITSVAKAIFGSEINIEFL